MVPKSSLPERHPLSTVPEAPLASLEDESPLVADERAYETLEIQETQDAFLEQAEDAPTTVIRSAQAADTATASPTAALPKDEVTVKLEKILEDGLGEYVSAMPEEARTRFLYKGQETAAQLSVMVRGLKIHAKKVVELIRDWLLTIPGVNKFFLEQEAKIKTDRVLELEQTYREQKQNLL
jgi:hypothetical protein